MTESVVPKSWELYGEAIKWFVAIATAMLAFGFDRAKDGSIAGVYWWIYLLGAVSLSLCVVAGLFAYLQLLGATNLLELPSRTPEQSAKFERLRRRLAASYQVCVAALAGGIVLSVIPWVGSVWPKVETSPPSAVLLAHPHGSDELLVTRRRGDVTEVLVTRADGSLAWVCVGAACGKQ